MMNLEERYNDDMEVRLGTLFTESGETVEAVCSLRTGKTIDFYHDDTLYLRLQPDHIRLIYGWLLQAEMKDRMAVKKKQSDILTYLLDERIIKNGRGKDK